MLLSLGCQARPLYDPEFIGIDEASTNHAQEMKSESDTLSSEEENS